MGYVFIALLSFFYIYGRWLTERYNWNNGICRGTDGFWIMSHMDYLGLRHYVSMRNGATFKTKIWLPVDRNYK